MKRILLSFVFLLTILFAFSGPGVFAQGRESGGKDREVPPILRGQEGIIDDLANAYCESSASPEIYVNPTNLPAPEDYDYVVWELYYYDGGGNEVYRNDLLNPIGSAPNNGVELDIPEISAEGLFNSFLVIEYSFRRGLGTFGGDFDYTIVRKDPEQFALNIDNSAVCLGEAATLTLESSEVGYLYYLYRDGVQQNTVGRNGTGNPISFIESSLPVGSYSYYVVAHVDDDDVDCETQMNGTPGLSVYPNPSASPDYRPSSGTAGDPICQGLPFELFDSAPETSGYVYNWTGPGLGSGVTGHTITVSDPTVLETPGDYDYQLEIVDTNNPTNCNATASVTVTIDEEPVIDNISNNGPLCVDGTLDLSVTVSGGTTPYSYSWSGPDGFTSTDQNPTVTNVTIANAGDYEVEVTDANGCISVTETTTVVINENPTIDDISSNSPVCEGGTLNLSVTAIGGSGPYTYSWSGPDGFTSTDQNPTISNVTLLNNGDYDVVVTDANGCGSATSSVSVVINENPVIDNISNNGPVCAGGTLDLSVTVSGGTAPYTYSWSGPDGFISTAQNPSIANATTANAGDYDVVVTDANGCNSVTGTTTVVVSDPVIDNISNDGPVCEGADINLSVTVSGGIAPYSYSWSGPDGFTSTDQNPTVTNVAVANAGIYDVTITDSNGCFVTGTTTVVINENPTIDDISSNSPVCEGGTLNLSVTAIGGSGPYTYSWSGPDGFTSTNQNPTISNVTLLNSGDYDVVVTDANGCGSATSSVSVVINENPVIDNISNNGPICAGSTLDLSVTVSGGTALYTYSWSGPDGFSSTAQNPSIANATTANAGDYDVVVTDANGCNSVTSSTTVVVNDLPIVNLPDASTCDGQDVTLTATPSGGSGNYVNYIWYDGGGTEIQSGTSDQLTLTGTDVELANNGATYSATVEDNNGCISAVDDMTLTVNENPSVEILYNTNPETAIDVCLGSSMTLDAQGSGGTGAYTYTWELPDGTTQTGAQVVVDPMALTDGGAYTVSVNDGNCVGTQTIDVTVVEVTATIAVTAPVAGATTICESTSVTFEAGGGDNYEFYHFDSSAGTTTMVYDAGNEWTTSTLEDGDQIYVTAFNALGCSDDSDPITMTVIANPTVAIDYPAGEDNEVCFGEDLSVVADPAGYSNYDFYIFDGTDHIKVSPDGYSSEAFTYPSDSFTDGDEFYIVASSGVGCSGESAHETVVVHTLPNATAANSGPECVGETISLQGGDAGLDSYEWFAPGADLTTDAPIATSMDHDLTNIASSDAGIYTLRVTNVNGCQATATTEVVVNELPVVSLPADYSVCEGTQNHEITATITNGTAPYNVVWEFDDGSGATTVLSGQDETIFSIGSVSAANEGTYTVTVTDANGCVSVQDNVYLTVDAAPGVAFDASSVTEVCDGAQVTLTAFGNGGVVSGSNTDDYEYVWYHEGTLINGVSTATYQFTGDNGINDGLYEVVAIDDNGNGCASPVASMNVTVYELPDATLDVNPAFFIEGTEVTFTAVDGYTSYEFQVNGTTVQGPGVDYVYQDATLQDGDEVTVFVTEDHGAIQCTNSSTVTMTVFDSVEQPVVSVTDEEYCAGAAGATVNVTNPQQDVTYEMVYDDGTAVSGYNQIVYDGTNSVSWSNVLDDNGGTSTPTTFRVKAFWAALTPDGDQLSDPFDITENPVPNQFTMSVDGNSAAGGLTETNCNAGTGYTIGLYDGWQSVDYYLILNGTQVLEVKSGSGVVSEFIFDDTYSYVGEYTIVAQNEFGCTTDILGSFIIEGDEVVIFDLNGENNGQYCEGDADGVELILSGSETGIEYELFRDGMSLGTFTGDGNPLSFGNYTEEGIYRVSVTSAGGCLYAMNNDVTVDMVAAPDEGILTDVNTNNFHFCEGSEGVDIYQDVVQIENYTYELVGPEGVVSTYTGDNSGTGITYEDITVPGEYFVRVTAGGGIGCSSETDVVEVVEDALPDQTLDVDLFGEKCGTYGIATIGIVSSQSGVQYYWENTTTSEVGTEVQTGNGGELAFNVLDEGVYVFHANIIETGCSVQLDNSVEVIEQPLPDDVDVRSEGGEGDCSEPAIIIIDYPQENVEYQLYIEEGGNLIEYHSGGPLHSGGDPIEFDPIIASNTTFVVIATNQITGCESRLSDEIFVNIAGAIKLQVLDPTSGDICNGEAGIEFRLLDSEVGVEYALCLEQGLDVADEIKQTRGGDGGDITFDLESDEGEYYVYAFSAIDGACDIEMANRVELIVNPLPIAYNMVGSGVYCGDEEGAVLGIENSQEGIIYRLQKHTEFGVHLEKEKVGTGDGEPLYFDSVDNIGTTYSVMAISDKGCTSSMKDSVEVSYSDEEPEVPDVTESISMCGESYKEVEFNSVQEDATYHLYDSTGELVSESEVEGGELVNPLYILETGEYTVSASWDGGCMSEGVTITVVEGAIPVVTVPDYTRLVCPGETAYIKYDISEDDQTLGWSYSIVSSEYVSYLSQADAELSENGDSLIWTVTDAGSYYVAVEGCDIDYSSRIDLEFADDITMPSFAQDEFFYCHNDDRVILSINNVDTEGNYVYRLIDEEGNRYGAVFSSDSPEDWYFEPKVGEDTPVSYGLVAKDIDSGCEVPMEVIEFVSVFQRPEPNVYEVTPEEIMINPSDGGVVIGLENSQTNVTYRLYLEGSTDVIDAVPGTDGEAVNFDPVVLPGVYEVYALFDGWGCEMTFMGSSTVLEEGISDYDVIVPRNFCEDDPTAVTVQLTGSDSGVTYRLWRSIGETEPVLVVGSDRTGNGMGFSFAPDYIDEIYYDWEISYYVEASKEGQPAVMMNDGAPAVTSVWERPSNQSFSVQNGGGQCYEGQPLTIQLDNAEKYYSYRLEYKQLAGSDEFMSVLEHKTYNGGPEYPSWDVENAGNYRIIAYNPGCQAVDPDQEVKVSEFEEVNVRDLFLRIDGSNISDTISLTDNAYLDPRLTLDQFVYEIEHPVVDSFTYENGYMDVETRLIESYGGVGRDLIYLNHLPGFKGKDFVKYSIAIEQCMFLDSDNKPVYEKADTGIVTVIISDEKLPNDDEVLIPNAFSPNDDGANDYFVISGTEAVNRSILTVFNRWGNLVFESKDKKYSGEWDGTSNVSNMVSIGEELPNGVYFYIYSVYVDGKKKEYNGFIELRR